MHEIYPARLHLGDSSHDATIENDGSLLRLSVLDVSFTGPDFDCLVIEGRLPTHLQVPLYRHKGPCSCTLTWEMPLTITSQGVDGQATLRCKLVLGHPDDRGGLDREELTLVLVVGDQEYASPGTSGWFEDELLSIERQLPCDTRMKACISCLFSDYNPVGHGLFGDLACFRTAKEAYLQVRNKSDIFEVWDQSTGYVQETFLCEEFAPRIPGTGYRG